MEGHQGSKPDTSGYNPKNDKKRRGYRLKRHIWLFASAILFRCSPFFCYGWRRFVLRCFGAKIAKTATIGRKAIIESPWNLVMGERSMICNYAWVMCYAPVIIGNQALVGEYARILTGSHISNSKSYKGITSSVILEDNSWIASCAIVSSGGYKTLKVGQGAIVGVGSIVVRSVKPMTIVMGNPAKFIADREFSKE